MRKVGERREEVGERRGLSIANEEDGRGERRWVRGEV